MSSWTQVFSSPLDFFGASDRIQRALGFRRNGETREIKDLRIIGYKKTIVDYYVESLVLLDKSANSEDTY